MACLFVPLKHLCPLPPPDRICDPSFGFLKEPEDLALPTTLGPQWKHVILEFFNEPSPCMGLALLLPIFVHFKPVSVLLFIVLMLYIGFFLVIASCLKPPPGEMGSV